MANPSWCNDNQFRDYPFVTRVEPLSQTAGFDSASSSQLVLHLPHSVILDFGAVMEIDANYDEQEGHYIYLYSIARFDDIFTFKLRTTAPDAVNHELVFHRELTSPEFMITKEDASSVEPEELTQFTCATQPRWSGFVVTGSMQELSTIIDNDETIITIPGLWQIEPARVQSLARSYLRSVSLSNAARVHATPAAGCSLDSSDAADPPAILNAQCLAGDLRLKEGFNCTIRQDVTNNAIIIGAGAGVGAGVPCEEIPLYEGELPPGDSPFLSGGPDCHAIVKSFNGVSGTDLTILAGPGFRIQADTVDPHKLIIDRSLDDFAICNTVMTTSSVSAASAASSESAGYCDVFATIYTAFDATIMEGLLADSSINPTPNVSCFYDAALSSNGTSTWISTTMTVSYWDNGSFCGFRWRVKIECVNDGLRVSIVVYPLADNNVCQVYSSLIVHPIVPPLNVSLPMTYRKNTNDCGCAGTALATVVQLVQL